MGALRFRKNDHRFWIISAAAIICLVLVICCLIRPITPKDPSASWPALTDTRTNYTAQKAEKDGCVVVDGSTLLAGEKLLADFVNDTAMGRPAAMRVYQSYSDPVDSYYVKELRYDGQAYHLQFYTRTGDTEEEFLSQNTYKYFIRDFYAWNHQPTTGGEYYLLSDNPEVTAQGYLGQILSSSFSPEYEIYNHCSMLLGLAVSSSSVLDTHDGVAFWDIDGDGVEEKCCLGMGRTSGLFTFTLNVYEGGQLEYENVYCTEFYRLRFLQAEDGTLQIEGITQGDDPETHIFDLVVQDGRIVLKEGDLEHLPYN